MCSYAGILGCRGWFYGRCSGWASNCCRAAVCRYIGLVRWLQVTKQLHKPSLASARLVTSGCAGVLSCVELQVKVLPSLESKACQLPTWKKAPITGNVRGRGWGRASWRACGTAGPGRVAQRVGLHCPGMHSRGPALSTLQHAAEQHAPPAAQLLPLPWHLHRRALDISVLSHGTPMMGGCKCGSKLARILWVIALRRCRGSQHCQSCSTRQGDARRQRGSCLCCFGTCTERNTTHPVPITL